MESDVKKVMHYLGPILEIVKRSYDCGDSVEFDLKHNKSRANRLTIYIDDDGTYTLRFFKIRFMARFSGNPFKGPIEIAEISNVPYYGLCAVIGEITGVKYAGGALMGSNVPGDMYYCCYDEIEDTAEGRS